MSKLISGKEAKLAWANGGEIQLKHKSAHKDWQSDIGLYSCGVFSSEYYEFRLKPKTITLGGIEIPAPFEPNEAGTAWFIDDDSDRGYSNTEHYSSDLFSSLGWWRTEEEIKQVVDALRKVFKGD